MKKLLFILVIITFLGSCAGEFDDVLYTINSEKGIIIPKIDFTGKHPKSINLSKLNKGKAGIFYTFSDNIPLPLYVKNTLSVPITIKAGNFIGESNIDEDDEGTSVGAFDEEQFTLTIKENFTEKALIYNVAPKFTITPMETDPFQSKSTVIEWELKDGTIYVVIYKRY